MYERDALTINTGFCQLKISSQDSVQYNRQLIAPNLHPNTSAYNLHLVLPKWLTRILHPQLLYTNRKDKRGFWWELPTNSAISDLPTLVRNRSILSAKIIGGWIFYANKNYNAGGDARVAHFHGTAPGTAVALRAFGGQIGSARYVGSAQDYRVDTITIFTRHSFQGIDELIPAQNLNIDGDVSSFVITGTQSWTVYDQPNFEGNSITFNPKPKHFNYEPAFVVNVADFRILPNAIKSVRIGNYGTTQYHV